MHGMNDSAAAKISTPWWVLCLCAAVSFAGIFDREAWTPDEPREVAIVLEMSRTGDFVIPHLAGKPFVEKPPLYYVAAAGVARALGPVLGMTGAIRLSTALWGLGSLAMAFLLARRLFDPDRAVLVCAVLSTMAGFVENMHWIRVDAALVFFVVAAAWCFGEVYVGQRRWFCLPAGLFAAGAFLSKGVIGPLLIGLAWLGLVLPWVAGHRRKRGELFILQHLLALLFFAVPAGAWMYLLRTNGGPELWHAWFYDNHFGRLSGAATALGHMRRDPFYYVEALVFYTLPWLPALVLSLASTCRELRGRRALAPARVSVLIWGLGAIVLLSISRTKRAMYLAPVLPALALLCVDGMDGKAPRWADVFSNVWMGLCLFLLAAFALSPLWAGLLPPSAPDKAAAVLRSFSLRHAFTAMAFLAGARIVFRPPGALTAPARLAAATALLYLGVFAVPAKALDKEKSLREGTVAFVSRIPESGRARVAGWNFTETTRAAFYYYCDWTVPLVGDKDRLARIVRGEDRDYDSVILSEVKSVPGLLAGTPYRVLAEQAVGTVSHRRDLSWIAGAGGKRNDAEPRGP